MNKTLTSVHDNHNFSFNQVIHAEKLMVVVNMNSVTVSFFYDHAMFSKPHNSKAYYGYEYGLIMIM